MGDFFQPLKRCLYLSKTIGTFRIGEENKVIFLRDDTLHVEGKSLERTLPKDGVAKFPRPVNFSNPVCGCLGPRSLELLLQYQAHCIFCHIENASFLKGGWEY